MKLKLELFVFQLRKITQSYENRRDNGMLSYRHKTETEPCLFSDAYKVISSQTSKKDISGFMQLFINNFAQSFKVNAGNTMALSLPQENDYCFLNKNENLFYGHFVAGPTGAKSVLFDTTDALNEKGTIQKDSVPTRPYFFKIWFPLDGNYGAVILQSTTSQTYNILFLKELYECFVSLGYKPTFGRFYTTATRNKFFSNCVLNEIKIQYAKADDAGTMQPKLLSLKNCNRVMTIKKICTNLSDIISSPNYIVDLNNAISEMDKNYTPNKDAVTLCCSTVEGEKATTTLSAIENFFPPILLGTDFYDLEQDQPNWEMLHSKSSELLKEIQSEYCYFPKPINL